MAAAHYFGTVTESPEQPLRNFPGEMGGISWQLLKWHTQVSATFPIRAPATGKALGESWWWSGATRGTSLALEEAGATQSSHCSFFNLSVRMQWFLVSQPDSEVKAPSALQLQSWCSRSLQTPSGTDVVQTGDCLAVTLQNPGYPTQ